MDISVLGSPWGPRIKFCAKTTRKKQHVTLVHFVQRFIFSQWILKVVVAGVEPTTSHFAVSSRDRYAIRLVGRPSRPTHTTSAEDPRIP